MTEQFFVYWDSSIWISFFLDDPKFPNRRSQFIDKSMKSVQEGSEIIVISDLILLELIGVLRERIIQKQKFDGINEDKRQELKKIADNKVAESLTFIRNLVRANRAVLPRSKMSVNEINCKTMEILNYSIFGDINKKDVCKKCRRAISSEYNLKYPGHYDIQHILLATEKQGQIEVKKIISADEVFFTISIN